MNKELKELNFKNLLLLDESIDVDHYDFIKSHQNGGHDLRGYCIQCEKAGFNVCPSDNNYKLLHISHGASTDDFLSATGQAEMDISDWHQEGVLFLMEGPSVDDWGLYKEVEFEGCKKKTTTNLVLDSQ